MRATERLRQVESQEAKRAWLHTLRDVIYHEVQVMFLLAGAMLWLQLSSGLEVRRWVHTANVRPGSAP